MILMTSLFLKAGCGVLLVAGTIQFALHGTPAETPAPAPARTLTTYNATGDASLSLSAAGGLAWRVAGVEAGIPSDGKLEASQIVGESSAWITQGSVALHNAIIEVLSATGAPLALDGMSLEFDLDRGPLPCLVGRIGDDSEVVLFDVVVQSASLRDAETRLEWHGSLALSEELAAYAGGEAGALAGDLTLMLALQNAEDGTTRHPNPAADQEGQQTSGGDVDIYCGHIGVNGGVVEQPNTSHYAYHGNVGGIAAFSTATTACTGILNLPAEWISGSSGRHPLITANLYRLLNGRYQQIGLSMVKHSFCAVDENTCDGCQADGDCDFLAPGCADTYTASRNGSTNLGLRSNINPWGNPTHTHPYTAVSGNATLRGRINVQASDLGNSGAQYILEVQYATHDEPLGNRHDNCSYRRINTTPTTFTSIAVTQTRKTALDAWKDLDPGVTVVDVDVPSDGRMEVAYRVTGTGPYEYQYVVHNQTSRRSAQSLTIPIPTGVTPTNVWFSDVFYHSGEPFVGTDWAVTNGGGILKWESETILQNPNANAIRWGTSYSFGFRADTAPTSGNATIGLFTSGTPGSVQVAVAVPSQGSGTPCPGDLDGDNDVDQSDLGVLLGDWGCVAPPDCVGDVDGDGDTDQSDLGVLLPAFEQPCP